MDTRPDRPPLGKRERTYARVLDAAGRGFRTNGYEGAGVDGLSELADVTSGAFYSHMGSKSAAFDKVLEAGLDNVVQSLIRIQNESGADWVPAFARHYLGQYDANSDCICVTASLGSDVARAGKVTQQIYADGMAKITQTFAAGLEDDAQMPPITRANASFNMLVGALTTLRGTGTSADQSEYISTMIEIAAKIAGKAKKAGTP